ncbi:MAG TPA: nucleotidyltransferase family protein [Acidimicrobiia bacterium]|nr:nucleotidyltransferase family protein [Acidimicrobiia bacterium]
MNPAEGAACNIAPPPHRRREAWAAALPTAEQSIFLRACVQPGPAGRDAWREWLSIVVDPIAAFRDAGEYRPLAALLYASLRDHEAELGVPREFVTVLRTAVVREEVRTRQYVGLVASMLATLESASVEPLVLSGASLAATVYPNGTLRHCHDLDLLVRPEELARAGDALRSLGCTQRSHAELVHPSRLAVLLHTTLLPVPPAQNVADRVRSRAISVTIAGRAACTLAPADALLHVCVHGFSARARRSIQWAVDAHFLVERHPDLDWAVSLETTRAAGLTVPFAVTLRFLHDELAAAVPRPVLDGLESAARNSAARRIAVSMLPVRERAWRRWARHLPAPARRVGRRLLGRPLARPSNNSSSTPNDNVITA